MESHCGFLSRGKQCLMKTIPAAVWRTEARRGAGEASQSPALSSSHGDGNEEEREQCGVRTGSNWWRLEVRLGIRAREPAPGQCAMRNNGNAGKERPFEWRREKNTGSFFPPFNSFQFQENVPGGNHWRHNQEAGNVDLRTIDILA